MKIKILLDIVLIEKIICYSVRKGASIGIKMGFSKDNVPPHLNQIK